MFSTCNFSLPCFFGLILECLILSHPSQLYFPLCSLSHIAMITVCSADFIHPPSPDAHIPPHPFSLKSLYSLSSPAPQTLPTFSTQLNTSLFGTIRAWPSFDSRETHCHINCHFVQFRHVCQFCDQLLEEQLRPGSAPHTTPRATTFVNLHGHTWVFPDFTPELTKGKEAQINNKNSLKSFSTVIYHTLVYITEFVGKIICNSIVAVRLWSDQASKSSRWRGLRAKTSLLPGGTATGPTMTACLPPKSAGSEQWTSTHSSLVGARVTHEKWRQPVHHVHLEGRV